ncbi:T9SS type A sorting domain-containing protein [Emticicia sp. BO119]|uniref:T9SS type A sorting domain-containing protein n=1 Tax=Emticicia sp. BO119 TaxID=2757768 RepID=UPI0015F0CEF2|nr:T9SS type A sorting domain-containing protein [Emticicia sp. BO119]MBA4850222.1 T9SS type A sorting domain-containing protein [Emticicia sp. BO119]
MRKIYLSGILTLLVMSAIAQKTIKPRHEQLARTNPNKIEFMKGKMIVCPGNYVDANTYIPPAKEIEEALKGKYVRSTAKATFIVNYSGFSPAAQKAFQLAVDIWSNLISSPVPIRIDAIWHPIDSGNTAGTILGQASPADFTRNFPGQQKASTWYPIALAEKIAGQELNSVNDADIVAEFNSSAPWYLGTSTPGRNEFDFASVVLHELCHGLGFTSSLRSTQTSSTAAWGYETGSPFIFDQFVENATGQQLIDTGIFPNPSAALRQQLVGNNLFFNSPASAAKGDEKPRLYAPFTYQAGSSTSHVDDNTYTSGNPNSLMTSAASLREVIRDPGPLVKNMFADMGWKGTSILHTPIKSIENSVKSVIVKATILSDTTLVAGSAKVYYTENDTITKAKAINLTRAGNTNEYIAVIPVTAASSIIRYYIVVEDNFKRKNTIPAEAPLKGYYGFQIGEEDVSSPFVSNLPLTFVPSTSKPDIFLNAEDDFEHGIDTVYVEYMVNGQAKAPVGLKKYNPATDDKAYSQGRNDAFAYLGKAVFGDLKKGDHVLYRIVAIDNSKNKNTTVLPSYLNTPGTNVRPKPDYYEFVVTDLNTQTPVLTYSTDFNSPNEDFAGIGGWGITQPSGFSDGALHSAHPYKNGGDENLESNTMALFLKPIELKSEDDSANITFDEIALIEPGANGSLYGDADFYDYVVVEGSYDGGASWIPFEDGYDATSDSEWKRIFNNYVSGTVMGADGQPFESADSKGVGVPSLYRKRTIKMLSSGDFSGGDVILLRFRLFSDQLTYGWGWAIDNLKIQLPPPPPVLAVEPGLEKAVTLSPNPSPDEIQISTTLAKPGRVKMEVFGANGKKVMDREFITDINTFYQKIDVSDFNAGTYLVRLYTETGSVVKRFVVSR